MFKVGDRVRCIDDTDRRWQLKEGDVYIVNAVKNGWVNLKDVGGKDVGGAGNRRFVLDEPEEDLYV